MNELAIESNAIKATILPEIGGRLHRLQVFGHDLLRTPDDTARHRDDPIFWGSYVMAPWCNRIEAAPLMVAGQRLNLIPNFPDGSIIHGQVFDRPWEQAGTGQLGCQGGGDGWPWQYEVAQTIEVIDERLLIALSLTNLADTAMPAGLGIHPWFVRPLEVRVPATSFYSPNSNTLAQPENVFGLHDLRRLQPMPDDLDATWTGLTERMVELRWLALGIGAEIHTDASQIVAASPRHIDAVGLEPQTHAPQGIRRLLHNEPDAMTLLEPAASLRLNVDLVFSRFSRHN